MSRKAPAYGAAKPPAQRIIVLMPEDELEAIDQWGVPAGLPSRTAAIRALLKQGLEAVRKDGGPAARAELKA